MNDLKNDKYLLWTRYITFLNKTAEILEKQVHVHVMKTTPPKRHFKTFFLQHTVVPIALAH